VHEKTGLLDLLTGSGRPRTSHSCVVQRGAVADWWYSWPMASTLASLCLSQRWKFWTYVVTIKYRENKLINFTHHTMLHTTGFVLKVHYKVWNVMFYFHKVVYVQYLGEVGIFHTWVKKFIPLYNSAKIINIDREFPKLRSQMYCHLFYGSQCILVFRSFFFNFLRLCLIVVLYISLFVVLYIAVCLFIMCCAIWS